MGASRVGFLPVAVIAALVGIAAPANAAGPQCTVTGPPGNNVIHGTPGPDVICAGAGNDVIYGGGGNDVIFGGPGNDTIYGGAGNDIIFGGPGNDTIYGGPGRDEIYGDSGNDTIYGGPGDDNLHGGTGNDTLIGAAGADDLDTGPGRDRANGGPGNNLIDGRPRVGDGPPCGVNGPDDCRFDVTFDLLTASGGQVCNTDIFTYGDHSSGCLSETISGNDAFGGYIAWFTWSITSKGLFDVLAPGWPLPTLAGLSPSRDSPSLYSCVLQPGWTSSAQGQVAWRTPAQGVPGSYDGPLFIDVETRGFLKDGYHVHIYGWLHKTWDTGPPCWDQTKDRPYG